jgi:hypothetical protein
MRTLVAQNIHLLMYGFPASEEQSYMADRQAFVRVADLATVVFNVLVLSRGLKLEAGNFPVSTADVGAASTSVMLPGAFDMWDESTAVDTCLRYVQPCCSRRQDAY